MTHRYFRRIHLGLLALIFTASLVALGISSLAWSATVQAQPDPNIVEVQLAEYEIRMPTTLPAGPTTFRVTNNGSVDHQYLRQKEAKRRR